MALIRSLIRNFHRSTGEGIGTGQNSKRIGAVATTGVPWLAIYEERPSATRLCLGLEDAQLTLWKTELGLR